LASVLPFDCSFKRWSPPALPSFQSVRTLPSFLNLFNASVRPAHPLFPSPLFLCHCGTSPTRDAEGRRPRSYISTLLLESLPSPYVSPSSYCESPRGHTPPSQVALLRPPLMSLLPFLRYPVFRCFQSTPFPSLRGDASFKFPFFRFSSLLRPTSPRLSDFCLTSRLPSLLSPFRGPLFPPVF